MLDKTILSLILLIGLLLAPIKATVPTVVTDYTGSEATRPVCAAPGVFQWASSSSTLTFDWSSFYYDYMTSDSAPLFVKKGGDGTNRFSFTA